MGLERLATEVATPGTPNFRRYLSVSRFASRFGAKPRAIAEVRAALSAYGLTVGLPLANDLSLPVTGTVGQVQAAFATPLSQVILSTGRKAYADLREPSAPSDVASLIQAVFGLNSLAVPAAPPVAAHPIGSPRTASDPRQLATGGPQPCAALQEAQQSEGLSGESARTADMLASDYQFSGLYRAGDLGAGVTVALPELETFEPSDLKAFEACYGVNTTVTPVPVAGGPASSEQEGEAALDIDNIVSLAPSANVLVYEGQYTSNASIEELFAAIASQDVARVMSSSLALCEREFDGQELQAESAILQEAAAQGQSFLNASGDNGSAGCQREGSSEVWDEAQPAQPFITGVGGTTSWDAGGSHREGLWNGPEECGVNEFFEEECQSQGASGGGPSSFWSMPSYQSAASPTLGVIGPDSTTGHCGAPACREVPDVSADADPRTGYMVFFHNAWLPIGGTSGATPLWGALIALADASSSCDGVALGFLNPSLYAIAGSNYGANFHDVSAASEVPFAGWATNSPFEYFFNNNQEPSYYPVTTGYDMTTGLGTPDGEVLAESLCSLGAASKRRSEEEATAAELAKEATRVEEARRSEEARHAEEARRAEEARHADEASLDARMLSLLREQLTPSGKRATIASLLRHAFTISFRADQAGTVTIDWYLVPRGAKLAGKSKPSPVLAAAGRATLSRAGTVAISVRLTRAGRRLLKDARRQPLTARGLFVAATGTRLETTRAFVVRR